MLALTPLLPLVAFGALIASGVSLPVLLASLQVTVLASYGLLVTVGAETRVAAVFERVLATVTRTLWRAIDVRVLDGLVNALGLIVRGWSTMLRRTQSGSVRVYAVWIVAGVVALLGYYLWR